MRRKLTFTTMILALVLLLGLSVTAFASESTLVPGPTVIADPNSPTGYTVQFVYKNDEATTVSLGGNLMLHNWADPSDTTKYSPFEYQKGFVRGGLYDIPMEKKDGYWFVELPLYAGANEYWFYIDGDTTVFAVDPANSPRFSPDGLKGTARRAFNAVYVPYDAEKQDALAEARIVENPRTDGKTGSWEYVPIPTQIDGQTRYLGVYVPYGYDVNRAEPYKTVYLQHGADQDASDWMNCASVPNIMDNLIADGQTEPCVIVTTDLTYMGDAAEGYPNLRNIIIPFIEATYNTSSDPMDRAFAGLSMGCRVTCNIINYDATLFGYYGPWSLTISVNNGEVKNLDKIYCFTGAGRYDDIIAPNEKLAQTLLSRRANFDFLEVPGAHDFNAFSQLFTHFMRDYAWKPEAFHHEDKLFEGANVYPDYDSPTGYTVQFVYKNDAATSVTFAADIMLRNWVDPTDTTVYTPFEYQKGFMRGGGAYEVEMEKIDGLWVTEVPLTAGANQYWFYVDGNRDYWVPDPVNSPKFAPDGIEGTARRAFNAVYVPYNAEKQDEYSQARVYENPTSSRARGSWSYVPITTQIDERTRYIGVYLPYGYNADREVPYKTIYMQHGGGQDASDWMNIGSVPNIMNNLVSAGLTEPAIVITTDATYLGAAQEGYPNLFNVVIPFVEETYNVSKHPMDRAFAGLSMGAGITAAIINDDATQFGYYGIFSGGNPDGIKNAANLDKVYLLIGRGQYERPVDWTPLGETDANFKYMNVAGAHDFNTWRQMFTVFARDFLWNPDAFSAN